jgi:putative ABC transport system substrate-binding protein
MRRRVFISGVGGAAVLGLREALAQSRTMPIVGFLGPTTASTSKARIDAFERRLRELGWADGRTLTIDYRWADGRNERFAEIANEFVNAKVDVIATGERQP